MQFSDCGNTDVYQAINHHLIHGEVKLYLMALGHSLTEVIKTKSEEWK